MGHLIVWSCLVALSLLGAWHGSSDAMVEKIRRLDPTQRADALNSLRSPYRGGMPAAMAFLSSVATVQGVAHGDTRALAYAALTAVSVVTVVMMRRGARRVLGLFEGPTAEDERAWERMRTTRRWVAVLAIMVLSATVLQTLWGAIDQMPLAAQIVTGALIAGSFVTAFGALFSWSSATASAPIRGNDLKR